jgi:hypothetical protein
MQISINISLRTCEVMIKQIQAALDNSGNYIKGDLELFKTILKRYVSGEIEVEDAYYDLLDSDLIKMPSRCAMYTKLQNTAEDEENLKRGIKQKLFNE